MFTRQGCKWLALACVVFSTLACSNDSDTDDQVGSVGEALTSSSLELQVSLRDTGTATLHASVYTSRWRTGQTVLAVHGLAETGFTFERLAKALIAQQPLIRRVVAIDLVGHGESSFPEGLADNTKFGDLMIEDSADVVVQVVDALRERGIGPSSIIAHSLGGLEVQTAQEQLLAADSSLAAHGVYRVVLLAPVPPHDRPWDVPASDLSPFVVQSEELGSYVSIPPAVWVAQAFSTPKGTLSRSAPSVEEIADEQYIGPEPLFSSLQLVEAPILQPDGTSLSFPRPSVRARAFAPGRGTRLTLVSFQQDSLVPAANLPDLYEYLTGDSRELRYVEVEGQTAVHSSYITEPQPIVDALRWRLAF
jgi:pimeloyl-ACP methyl ester carboxylesterase